MANTDLSQFEADRLLEMEKVATSNAPHDFPTPGMKVETVLESRDGREQFLFTMDRGRIKTAKVKYQTRARTVVVLARLELEGAPHRNPDGAKIEGPHIHLYREGYGDKWAYPLPPEHFTDPSDAWQTLLEFFAYCRIVEPPTIERGVLI